MTTYRYPLPRRYRRARYPYRFRKRDNGAWPAAVIAGAVLLAGAGTGAGVKDSVHHVPSRAGSAVPSPSAAKVIAFAAARVGKVPYVWGGTTDAGMDCSGLAMEAYAAAGVSIERTSQQQWASERHVPGSQVTAGDLVFFAGSDGTPAAPGHVGIVTDPRKHTMIDAYVAGTLVRYDTYGLASSAPGLTSVVGFTDPAPVSPATAAAPGTGETGFISAVLAAVGAPDTDANQSSMTAWYSREYPSWPPKAQNDPYDTTLALPGSWNYNTFGGGLHVQSYPSAAEGVRATALTLLGGYPLIVTALRSGAGVCGYSFAAELARWSGDGYTEVCQS